MAARPDIDDHLATPNTREEWFDGELMFTKPEGPVLADCRSRACYVVRGCAARGYSVAKNLLTRVDDNSDFGTGISIRKVGNNPRTGRRHLEEACFEVADRARLSHFGARAVKLLRRGARRCFIVVPNEDLVAEWDEESGAWIALVSDAAIVDPTLALPLPVAAFACQDAADGAVFLALWKKKVPVLIENAEKDPARLLGLLIWYKFRPSDAATLDSIRETIHNADRHSLFRWAERVVNADQISDVFVDG